MSTAPTSDRVPERAWRFGRIADFVQDALLDYDWRPRQKDVVLCVIRFTWTRFLSSAPISPVEVARRLRCDPKDIRKELRDLENRNVLKLRKRGAQGGQASIYGINSKVEEWDLPCPGPRPVRPSGYLSDLPEWEDAGDKTGSQHPVLREVPQSKTGSPRPVLDENHESKTGLQHPVLRDEPCGQTGSQHPVLTEVAVDKTGLQHPVLGESPAAKTGSPHPVLGPDLEKETGSQHPVLASAIPDEYWLPAPPRIKRSKIDLPPPTSSSENEEGEEAIRKQAYQALFKFAERELVMLRASETEALRAFLDRQPVEELRDAVEAFRLGLAEVFRQDDERAADPSKGKPWFKKVDQAIINAERDLLLPARRARRRQFRDSS